jgi:hypothetical protein
MMMSWDDFDPRAGKKIGILTFVNLQEQATALEGGYKIAARNFSDSSES